MVVRVDLSSASERQIEEFFSSHPDILGWGESWVEILAEQERVDALAEDGLESEVIIADARAYEQNLRDRAYFDYFHDYQEIVDEVFQTEADYPEIVKIYDIGDGWEKTQGIADRDIWAVKISDDVEAFEREEPEVFIMSNIHAREIITPEITTQLISYLTSNYGTDPRVTALVDSRQIWIVPTCNPDGLDYVHHDDIWWRKNRRDNEDGTFGVDLNRNFGYMWGYDDIGSSPYPWDETYRGTAPFSEPESQAIRDFTEAHNFVINLSYHSFGNWWLYPWGYIPENTPDHETFVAIADSCVAYNGYLPGNSASGVIYPTNGGTDDWFYGEQTTKYKVFGFTPEVGDAFHPDTTEVEELVMENLGPNLYVIEAAEQYSPRPVIEHTPLGDTEDMTGPYRVAALITGPVWPLDETSPELHYAWDDGEFQSTPLLPTGQPDEYEAYLPGPSEPGSYCYYLSAVDSIPRVGYAPPGAPDSTYCFAVQLDSVPPVIVHSPLGDQSVLAAPYLVAATVTDNIGVQQVWIEYRVNEGAIDTEPMIPQEGDLYYGWLDPQDLQSEDVIEYRIVARDEAAAENTASHPEEGFHSFSVLEGYSYDFESYDGGFTASAGGDWEWGDPTTGPGDAHSGQNVWATNLVGNYQDVSNSTLDTPPFTLVNATEATLTFWHWYRIEYSDNTYWDGANVKISANGGETFELIYPEDGYDGTVTNPANPLVGEPVFGGPASNGNFWHQESFDLSAYLNREVIVRFHFGSDAYVTDLGWYIDDILLPTPQSEIPLFRNTTQLPATADTTGPYLVTTEITDDEGITNAVLYHRSEGGRFTPVSMQLVDGFTYQGEIPGHSYETTVDYYLSALDTEGNSATDPSGAPDTLYSFLVTESEQQLGPIPDSFVFSAEQGGAAVDTLVISNLGLIDLVFSLSDTAELTQGQEEGVVSDLEGDTQAGSPDIVEFRGECTADDLEMGILFAPGWPEASLAVVSVDLDQDCSTGAMPPGLGIGYQYHDVGSEAEIIVDPSDLNEVGFPNAIVLTSDGNTLLGIVPITTNEDGIAATIPLDMLYNDDGNMNVCLLAFSDVQNLSDLDFAPDIGHGVIGNPGDASWLSATPASGSVPGESSAAVELVADATYLPAGQHEARLYVSTNDPLNPETIVAVTFDVEPQPAAEPRPVPRQLTLSVGPNPFRESTTLELGLPTDGQVVVRVYDLLGRQVSTIAEEEYTAGWHTFRWAGDTQAGRRVASGVYFCRAATPAGVRTIRVVKSR
jgi:hypothetical protein